jgi:hypothetical protein
VLAPTADNALQLVKVKLGELEEKAAGVEQLAMAPDAPPSIWQAVAAIRSHIKELQVEKNLLLSQAGEWTGWHACPTAAHLGGCPCSRLSPHPDPLSLPACAADAPTPTNPLCLCLLFSALKLWGCGPAQQRVDAGRAARRDCISMLLLNGESQLHPAALASAAAAAHQYWPQRTFSEGPVSSQPSCTSDAAGFQLQLYAIK